MEIVSPLGFVAAFVTSPLTRPWSSVRRFPLSPPAIYQMKYVVGFPIPVLTPPGVLVVIYLIHYANRAIISPLRTPVRSKSHIIVLLSAVTFNAINGPLLGAFCSALATPSGQKGLLGVPSVPQSNATFWLGVVMWLIGFGGNIWHDEVLLKIRREPKSEGRASSGPGSKEGDRKSPKPHYAIPYGGLYKFISYPNYFSEWFEWTGYAVAGAALANQLPAGHAVYPFIGNRVNLGK